MVRVEEHGLCPWRSPGPIQERLRPQNHPFSGLELFRKCPCRPFSPALLPAKRFDWCSSPGNHGAYMELLLSCLSHPLARLCIDTPPQSFYTDNLLCSSVEYMLCSNAVRLAQALGLNHEQTPPTTPGQSTQAAQRKRIWWALYCYDKLISMRLGRQSCIDDDEFVAVPESVSSLTRAASASLFPYPSLAPATIITNIAS